MDESIFTVISLVLESVITLLRQRDVPLPIIDTLRILSVVVREGEDAGEELKALKAQVEAMAQAGRDPTVKELDDLQDRARGAMEEINRLARERSRLPADE